MGEERVVVLPLAPSRRLAPGARFRSFKTQADRIVWADAWARVEALAVDGWALHRVVVDWGKTLPLLPTDADAWLADLCGGAPVSWEWSGRGRGETRAYLKRA